MLVGDWSMLVSVGSVLVSVGPVIALWPGHRVPELMGLVSCEERDVSVFVQLGLGFGGPDAGS